MPRFDLAGATAEIMPGSDCGWVLVGERLVLILIRSLGIAALGFHSGLAEHFPCPRVPWTAILRFTVKKQIPINDFRVIADG